MTAGEKGAAYSIGGGSSSGSQVEGGDSGKEEEGGEGREQTGIVQVFESIEVVETTGAGDAFSAGFISEAIKLLSSSSTAAKAAALGLGGLGRAAGGGRGGGEAGAGAGAGDGPGSAREMVRFASAVGALTCCGDGAIKPQPLRGDVLRLLQREGDGDGGGGSSG